MIKKTNDFLAGWPMTIIGGVFLAASFILPRTGYPAGECLAWVCVIICGLPLLYLSIWRIIYKGKASVIAADSEKIIGIIALSDVLRPEAADMVKRLSAMGTKSVLLTGDNEKAASYFASKIGLTEVHADLLPEEKVENINKLKVGGQVCMIGDGVNDAPALKTADVGVAMGVMGSDIAAQAADVALMADDLSKLPYLKWLSDITVKTIKTAITLSMCINFVAITLSVLGVLTPTTGALVHNAGSCFVVLLAALLYDRKYKNPAKVLG